MITMLFRKCSILFLVLLVPPYAECFELGINGNLNGNLQKLESITVIGRLLCHGEPLLNVLIELHEADTPDPDDFLNKTRTNAAGKFSITGSESEHGGIEPYMKISDVHCCASYHEKFSVRVFFGNVREFAYVRHNLGNIEMANVYKTVHDNEKLTLGEFLASSQELEDYDTRYVRLLDLRFLSNTRDAARALGKTVGISGQVMCAGKPLQHLKVKLFGAYSGYLPTFAVNLLGNQDTVLNRSHTDSKGRFVLIGQEGSTITPYLTFSNVTCRAGCTGNAEFKFVLQKVIDISVFSLGTIDLVNACQQQQSVHEFRHDDYDVSGRLTCNGKALSGVHVTLYNDNPFFAYAPTAHRLIDMYTTDTGHFALRTTAFEQAEATYLRIDGITCGGRCNGAWSIYVYLGAVRDQFVRDLESLDMTYVCRNVDSDRAILLSDFITYGVEKKDFHAITAEMRRGKFE